MRNAALLALAVLTGCDRNRDASVETPPSEAAKPFVTVQPPQPTTFHRTWPAEWDGKHFSARGAEPFWSVEVLPDKLIYRTPEGIGSVIDKPRFETRGKIHRYTGSMDGRLFSLVIERRPCHDGTSDTAYLWDVSLKIGDKTEHGCGIAE